MMLALAALIAADHAGYLLGVQTVLESENLVFAFSAVSFSAWTLTRAIVAIIPCRGRDIKKAAGRTRRLFLYAIVLPRGYGNSALGNTVAISGKRTMRAIATSMMIQ